MLARIAFSTLACPHWTIETIIANARRWGFDGVEWRGGVAGHVRPDSAPGARAALRQGMRESGLVSIAVTAYSTFVSDEPRARAANVEQLKQHLDLAADIGAAYVRTFLGEFGPPQTHEEMIPRIVDSLAPCVEYARRVGVGIAVEHHDAFVRTASIVPILDSIPDRSLGAVWDIANAYSAGENVERGIQNLDGRIFYVQLKDGIGQNEAWRLTNVGEGEAPLRRGLELLVAQNFRGPYSIEWEYAWHPELEPPERALPAALKVVSSMFAKLQVEQSTVVSPAPRSLPTASA
ncbi:MAG: sugar phosphate isomerase/epimerase [Anaerolineae bacterium]|nr:sugar phosphate isomerase/epimerase [Anaerolineae bacterium]